MDVKINILDVKSFSKLVSKLYGYDTTELVNNIKYFNSNDLSTLYFSKNQRCFFIYALHPKEKIIGLIKLMESPYNESGHFWIQYNSVHPKFRNQGISKLMIRKMFEFANKNNFTLESSTYSLSGFKYIKPFKQKLLKEYPNVKHIDKEEIHPVGEDEWEEYRKMKNIKSFEKFNIL